MGQLESHTGHGDRALPVGRRRALGPLWTSTLSKMETTRLVGALAAEPDARARIEEFLAALPAAKRRRMVKHIARRLAGSLTTTDAVLPALNDLALELNAAAAQNLLNRHRGTDQ